jgi:hypothetical protein
MPLLIPLIIAALGVGTVGGVIGYTLGDGVSGGSRLIRWAVIGGAVYAVASSGLIKKIAP